MMLFPAVLMNFPNLKVCLIGEWSIAGCMNVILNEEFHIILLMFPIPHKICEFAIIG